MVMYLVCVHNLGKGGAAVGAVRMVMTWINREEKKGMMESFEKSAQCVKLENLIKGSEDQSK